MQTSRTWSHHIKQNQLEKNEVEELMNILGTSSKSETYRLAVKNMLTNKLAGLPEDVHSDRNLVSMYAQMLTDLRIALYKVTSLAVDSKRKEKRKVYQTEAKAIKELINCVAVARKEEYHLRDIITAKEKMEMDSKEKEIELKQRMVENAESTLEHRKNMDILDRS